MMFVMTMILAVYLPTKFEVHSCSRSRDVERILKFQSRSCPIPTFSNHIQIWGGICKICESQFQVQRRTQSLIYFWCGAARRTGRCNTFSGF